MTSVSRETAASLNVFKQLVLEENQRQNLISTSTIATFDQRHIDDGVQLAELGQIGEWCDIGSGAGLPGIVIALVTGQPMTLIEPRKLRADFLRRVVATLGIDAEVAETRAERLSCKFDNITARAVATLPRLLPLAHHLAHPTTRWILPKGRSASNELAEVKRSWQGEFRLVQSQTSAEAMIVVAEGVRRKGA